MFRAGIVLGGGLTRDDGDAIPALEQSFAQAFREAVVKGLTKMPEGVARSRFLVVTSELNDIFERDELSVDALRVRGSCELAKSRLRPGKKRT